MLVMGLKGLLPKEERMEHFHDKGHACGDPFCITRPQQETFVVASQELGSGLQRYNHTTINRLANRLMQYS